jgi:chaperonin cofactor prefoldin
MELEEIEFRLELLDLELTVLEEETEKLQAMLDKLMLEYIYNDKAYE